MSDQEDVNTSALEALAAIGITQREIEETLEALQESRSVRDDYDPRICLCGHAVKRHTSANGYVYCKPSKMSCPCKTVRPVLEVQDIRKFLRKTTGAGPLHALSLGIASHVLENKSVKWIVDLVCDRCGDTQSPVTPVPVTQRGHAAPRATGYDALLCTKCRTEI